MMEETHHVTTQNRFYPDRYNVNKNITVEAKVISPPTHIIFEACLAFPCISYCLISEKNIGKNVLTQNVFYFLKNLSGTCVIRRRINIIVHRSLSKTPGILSDLIET